MRAQVHNDAAGWDDPAYAPFAEHRARRPGADQGQLHQGGAAARRSGFRLAVGARPHRRLQRLHRLVPRVHGPRPLPEGAHELRPAHRRLHGHPPGRAWPARCKGGAGRPTDAARPARRRRRGPPGGASPSPSAQASSAAPRRVAGGAARRRSAPPEALAQPDGHHPLRRRHVHVAGRQQRRRQPARCGSSAASGDALGALRRPDRRGADDGRAARRASQGIVDAWTAAAGVALDGGLRGVRRLPRAPSSTAARSPTGTYRFVVDGVAAHRRLRPSRTTSSRRRSACQPWQGVTAGDARVEPGGDVSFTAAVDLPAHLRLAVPLRRRRRRHRALQDVHVPPVGDRRPRSSGPSSPSTGPARHAPRPGRPPSATAGSPTPTCAAGERAAILRRRASSTPSARPTAPTITLLTDLTPRTSMLDPPHRSSAPPSPASLAGVTFVGAAWAGRRRSRDATARSGVDAARPRPARRRPAAGPGAAGAAAGQAGGRDRRPGRRACGPAPPRRRSRPDPATTAARGRPTRARAARSTPASSSSSAPTPRTPPTSPTPAARGPRTRTASTRAASASGR